MKIENTSHLNPYNKMAEAEKPMEKEVLQITIMKQTKNKLLFKK